MSQKIELDVAWIGEVHDNKENKVIEAGNSFNEISEISTETMNANGLKTGFLMIKNMSNDSINDSYCKIVTLIDAKQSVHQKDTIYINKNIMENLRVSIGDKVEVCFLSENISYFHKASQITLSKVEDSSYSKLSTESAKTRYLKPYFQAEPEKNYNYVVKKGEILKIEGKKFKVIDFTFEKNEKKKNEFDEKFALIATSTKIKCKSEVIKINQNQNSSGLQLKVKTLTKQVLKNLNMNKKQLNYYDTTILLSQQQKKKLIQFNSNIIYIRGKNGKYLYCIGDEIPEQKDNDDYENNIIYVNEIMQFNLNINENDFVTISVDRSCKRMINQNASRILVTPILKEDIDTNNDYNDNKILINEYLKPYFSSNGDKVIGDNQTFSTFCDSKRMDFLVLEVEAFDIEQIDTNCIVNDSTEIEVDIDGVTYSELKQLNSKITVSFDKDIGFLNSEWQKLCNILDSNNSVLPTNGVLLHGSSGTGKTFMMQAISNKYSDSLSILNISGPTDILSSEIGESERKLKRSFKYIVNNAPGILFIDDIDSILCYSHIKSALIGLINSYKNRGILIIAATNKINSIDVSLRRGGLFEEEIVFNIPDTSGREQILQKMIKEKIICSDSDESDAIKTIAVQTNGFVGADLNQLYKTAKKEAIRNNNGNLLLSHFLSALEFIVPSSIKDIAVVEKPNVDWDDIGGLEKVKEKMIEMIENPLKFSEIFEKYSGCVSRGCLLWGPPGNGKTFLGKAIATKCNTNFIYIKGPELLSKFHGQSEENIRNLFEKARSVAPTILFFDELDALAPVRGKSGNSTSDRVVNQLLAEMDGISKTKQNTKEKQIFYLGATNRPDMIDPALKRPGRLEQMIYINLPDDQERILIFKAILKKINQQFVAQISDKEFERISDQTERFSGADIKGIVDKAINKLATREIRDLKKKNKEEKNEDDEKNDEEKTDEGTKIDAKLLEEIIKYASPSVTKTDAKGYNNLKKQYNHQYSKKNENKLYFVENIQKSLDVKNFIDDVFGKDTLKAQEIFEFLIDPQKGAIDSLNDFCEMEKQDFEELCYELKIKYGHKIKFNRAFNKLKIEKQQQEQKSAAVKTKKRKKSNAKRNSLALAQSHSPNNPPKLPTYTTVSHLQLDALKDDPEDK